MERTALGKPVYVLGTGLSHNGSAVLLKDGHVCVAIEKERLTRRKHDGGNDTTSISYCLEAEGISLEEVSLVVQCANFEVPDRRRFHGRRLFADGVHPPLADISHHLAHAYSAAGTCPFAECGIMVIDGCGSPFEQVMDGPAETFLRDDFPGMQCEKESFYHFDGRRVLPLFKDFSPMATDASSITGMQTTRHSIGGFYAAVSRYVFGNLDDVGKLMGLAPYGRAGAIDLPAFTDVDGRLFVTGEWQARLDRPAADYGSFKADFQYYADIARWAQEQVEMAVAGCFRRRLLDHPHRNVAYSGGVALNAVANAMLLDRGVVEHLYIEPAAGDNGLALGCAYYGWMELLGQERVLHDTGTCFGKTYSDEVIHRAISSMNKNCRVNEWSAEELPVVAARHLAEGKVVGWFQEGSEFGPRALGHRSILAHPGLPGLADRINARVKLREDFRPFAPAVLARHAADCFESGRYSPYMILVDRTRNEWRTRLGNVTHVDGTARVQTVDASWNYRFHRLLECFHEQTGIPVLLNTSLNQKGSPMVESPEEAVALFHASDLDVLVMGPFVVEKSLTRDGHQSASAVDQ